ncbi:MAG TPA: AMP-binding protein [Nocardioidaceae bacterium]|nr:AMP-binding protein [Nocardioidaceae bacterium]
MPHVEIEPGDRVALLVPGSEDYVRLVIGFLQTGVVPVPLDPRLTESERRAVLEDVEPALVVDDPDQVAALLAEAPDPVEGGVPRIRPMHLTSGTTGSPKGVWSGPLDERSATALVEEERELWGFAGSDVHLVLSPLYHSAPLRFAVGTLLAGGRIVVPGGFDPARVTAAIVEHRPTTMFCVPAHLQRLFARWDEVGVPDLSSFRLVAHAGAPCPPTVKRRLLELFPAGTTWEFYGSTEGQFTACRSEEWAERPGTVGRARPGRTLQLDDDGTIWCVVPDYARFSYWNAPEKTEAAWRQTADGSAFTVGDLGRMDEEGYLYLEGRRDDLIISGGVNVYPVEVENVLGSHPAVDDVAVFGVDDEQWGLRVCAAVVGAASPDELEELARERLAPPKRPKDYFVVDKLPRTPTGKVRRLQLPGFLGL